MKPVVKWAGGKTQLLNEIKQRMPKDFHRLVEPFVGGGTLFLDLELDDVWINDGNQELVNLYHQIKSSPKKLAKIIDEFSLQYDQNPEQFFYFLRDFDRNQIVYDNLSLSFKAARTLFLNKTDFNGLHRVNSNNFFNVPWGKKLTPPQIINQDFLRLSNYLKKIKITNLDYQKLLKDLRTTDFVYLDPPYDKLNESTFTKYNALDFSRDDQIELKNFCDELTKKGIKLIQSNHYTKFICDLYKDYRIEIVYARRNINANGQKRNEIEEVLIMNY